MPVMPESPRGAELGPAPGDDDAPRPRRSARRCPRCGRFAKADTAGPCPRCKALEIPTDQEPGTVASLPEAEAAAIPRFAPQRLQHEVFIPRPSQLHPDRAELPAGAVLHSIGPAAAKRRSRSSRVRARAAYGVTLMVAIGLAVLGGALIAWLLSGP